MPQAVLGIAFSFGIPMAFAAVRGECAGARLGAAARQRLLGARLRHRVRDGRSRRRHPHRHPHLGAHARPLRRGRRDGVLCALPRAWAAIGAWLGLGWPYFVAIGVGAAIALWHYTLIRARSREGCFRAFRLNHWLGFTLFAGIAVEAALRR